MNDEDKFCVYCQRDFTTRYRFLKHVKREHYGVYLNLREKDVYAEEVGRLECENPY